MLTKFKLMLSRLTGPLLLLPALVLIGVFVIFPVVWAFVVSFTGMTITGPTAMKYIFVGLENYFRLLTDPEFWNSLRASFLFTVFSALVGQAFLGLFLAIVLRMEEVKGKLLVALPVFLAWIIPDVVAGYIWYAYTQREGLFNTLLNLLGIHVSYNWPLDKPLEVIIIANIWRGTAFSMILFMAALESIPKYVYEAAMIDGANAWQRFRYITLPLIAHAIIIDFILITIWTFAMFSMVYVLLGKGGTPGNPGEIWTIFVYKRAFEAGMGELGYAAAAANVMFLIVLALIIAYLKLIRLLERWRA